MFTNISYESASHLSFEIQDVDLSIVNALRRIVLSEIPNVALMFDPLSDNNPDITIKSNTSALHNEFLGHRISLVPLCLSEEEIETFQRDDYKFVIKVKNTTTETISVTTEHIQVYDKNDKKYDAEFHARVFPKNAVTQDHVLIVKLRPNLIDKEYGEEVDIKFYANKNIAKEHSRWSPVSCCSHWHKVDEAKAQEALHAKLAKLVDAKGSPLTDDERSKATHQFNTLERYRHFVVNKYGEPSHFHFQIESECAMTPVFIFKKAIDVLHLKLNDFKKAVGKDTSSGADTTMSEITIKTLHDNECLFEVDIPNETFTLVNVLQSMIYNTRIRNGVERGSDLVYIGYYQPHPLDPKMAIKLKFSKAKTHADVRAFLVSSVEDIAAHVQHIRDEWERTM